ncbi:hypothetical protein BMETH_553_1 [methanotrophic bacterial endosymbiont of Bathymodiolus sp.]|nr:hypothetical protein BMETH_553_1 [methanotrophic bacterial endosymbiont of Bathymodiolus sp.]
MPPTLTNEINMLPKAAIRQFSACFLELPIRSSHTCSAR